MWRPALLRGLVRAAPRISSVQYRSPIAPVLRFASVESAPEAIEDAPAAAELPELHPDLTLGLARAGVTSLFPVQQQTFALGTEGKDLFVRSRTGSGKTLGFALPILNGILNARDAAGTARLPSSPSALVLAPTRELARQVASEFDRTAPTARVVTLYGGAPRGPQAGALRRGVDVVVATPGRCMDLMEQGELRLDSIKYAVLDEADEMLRMGFAEDVETIFGQLPEKGSRWTSMWSATKPSWVARAASSFLSSPQSLDLVGEQASRLPPSIRHIATLVTDAHREAALAAVLAEHMGLAQAGSAHAGDGPATGIIFTKTKRDAAALARLPALRIFGASALHGDMGQTERDDAMRAFRKGSVRVLVATDVAARGLDVPHVALVVHHTLPDDHETFVHRSGRTGRAGRDGTNVMLCDVREFATARQLMQKYSFTAEQRALPSSHRIVELASAATARDLASLSDREVQSFVPAAEKLAEEGGAVKALAAALARLCPLALDAEYYSAMDGQKHMATILVPNAGKVREGVATLASMVAPLQVDGRTRNEYVTKGGVVLDVPTKVAREVIGKGGVELVETVPELRRDKTWQVNRNYSGPAWKQGGGGGNYRGGWGGRGDKRGGQGGRWNDNRGGGYQNHRGDRYGGHKQHNRGDRYGSGGRQGGRYESPGGKAARGGGNSWGGQQQNRFLDDEW